MELKTGSDGKTYKVCSDTWYHKDTTDEVILNQMERKSFGKHGEAMDEPLKPHHYLICFVFCLLVTCSESIVDLIFNALYLIN